MALPLPIDGLAWFLSHPRLWWRPLLAYAVGSLVLLLMALLAGWLCWPTGDLAWFHWLWRVPLAIGAGAAAGILAWSVIMPLVLALVFDAIARAALRERGEVINEEPLSDAIPSTMRVVIGTIPLRLRWMAVALVSGFAGPFGIPVATYAMARVAMTDAYDTVLAQRGLTGEQRLAELHAAAPQLRRIAVIAGALQLLLALTFVGWLLWMPALVAGAARGIRSQRAG